MQPEVSASWNNLKIFMKIKKFIILSTVTDTASVQEFTMLVKYTATYQVILGKQSADV